MATSNDTTDNLSALAWVVDELRRSLDAAHKALRRHLKEAEAAVTSDIDDVDPAVLRQARTQVHQSVGALELVGLVGPAQTLRATEAALQRLSSKPLLLTIEAVQTIEQGSFAVLDFLTRKLAGKPLSPVALFPQYKALQELAGASRVHPADLWPHDWQWHAMPVDAGAAARHVDLDTVTLLEAELLSLMRGAPQAAAARMSVLFDSLATGASGHRATLWQLAAAFSEAIAQRLLPADLYAKRVASRLLAQMRAGDEAEASDRLAQDLLFFCAQAQITPEHPAGGRLAAVRSAFGLAHEAPVEYAVARLGRFDPALIAQARKRVAAAKEVWSAVAGGELARLPGLAEPFSLVGDSLQKLYPQGEALGRSLQAAVAHVLAAGTEPDAAMAMEVATGLLYLDASLEDGEFDHPDTGARVRRLAQRIDEERHGRDAGPLELWMEELYRRVSDRQTIGSVVQELRASLSEIEKQIDTYFRNPAQREVLIPVPAQLQSMRGVLSVLGMDQASQAVLRMRDDVDVLANTEVDAQRAIEVGTFDRLADNLGALSFLIDMVSVQPQMAKSLFRFDPSSGNLTAVMGRAERPSGFADLDTVQGTQSPGLMEKVQELAHAAAQPDADAQAITLELERLSHEARAADQHGLAEVASRAHAALARAPDADGMQSAGQQLAESINDFVSTHSAPLAPPLELTRPVPPPGPPVAPGQTGLEDDDEMREIFLEEAHEVVANARTALGHLSEQPDDMTAMTIVRRAFHTLKGSSRMVGLGELGEAAWACEQLYNARLADSAAADAPLRHFTADALDEFARWVDAIGAGDASAFGATGLAQRADALHAPPPAPIAVEPVEPVPALPSLESLVPDLPQASDLDFSEATLPLPPGSVAEQLSQAIEADEPSTLDLMLPELAQPAMPPAEPLPEGLIDLDLASLDEPEAAPAFVVQPTPATVIELRAPAPEPEPEPEIEQVKVIGPLRIGIPLFNIYLNEADELSRRLVTELAEWTHELSRPVGETAVALAHSLAGSSATVGYADLSALARALEHALMRSNARGGGRPAEAATYHQVGEEIRRLLHQFAAGFLRSPEPGLIEQLAEFEHLPVPTGEPVEPPDDAAPTTIPAELTDLGQPALMPFAALADAPLRPQPVKADALDTDEDIDVEDALDQELFPIFEEEGSELIPQLQSRLRDWARRPGDAGAASACMRTLHTLKGGARLAGAMHLGEMAHRLETAIEHLLGSGHTDAHDIDRLVSRADAMEARFEALRRGPVAPVPVAAPAPAPALVAKPAAAPMAAAPVVPMVPAAVGVAAIDWARFAAPVNVSAVGDAAVAGVSTAAVRVRAPLLDRLVNHAGEVSITRARIESDVGNLKASIGDLTDNLERLRHHLRDIELQAESQIETRMEAARAAGESFDPLEMDRFTRFQELTRMMAESVNDVATVQRVLQRTLQSTEDELAHQARLTRDMQEDLLRTRMVEFEGLSERLYRVVRQAAKETGKQVRLDIVGGSIEIDRGVLDRMTGAFEHLLRNCVAHGIEAAATRVAAGKEASGTITISVTQEGNEVGVDFRDDGAGLNLPRIREKALASGLLAADAQPSDGELANLIFQPGFSTADEVTGLAGRGVGMDVVRADVNAMGGRIETSSAAGQGTSFRLVLPLTTAVTQVVMLRCGELNVAVPSTLVEIVRRLPAAELVPTYERGTYRFDDRDLPFFWLGALLQGSGVGVASGRSVPVVVIRSAAQRVVLQVDEVLGNQEVVVKNLGPQLSRLPGLAGMTLLPSGAPALIYNPVALATLYGTTARAATLAALAHSQTSTELAAAEAAQRAVEPLVLVVDDSLTVRRVTQRLLQREGYRVEVAKDGLEGLERLAAERPAVLLSDIEMPRMDGFDLVRNLRADARLADLPVIMITSRIAQKHRDYAQELGVNHYLGKPYAEDELLALVARYARAAVAV